MIMLLVRLGMVILVASYGSAEIRDQISGSKAGSSKKIKWWLSIVLSAMAIVLIIASLGLGSWPLALLGFVVGMLAPDMDQFKSMQHA